MCVKIGERIMAGQAFNEVFESRNYIKFSVDKSE